MSHQNLSAAEALEKLKEGNQRYLTAAANPGDVSPAIRQYTCENGQSPYAVVITCSDSRVIPESIFSAGIGGPSRHKTGGGARPYKLRRGGRGGEQ